MRFVVTLLLCLNHFFVRAQLDTIPVQAIVSTNQIHAVIQSNGTLFWDGLEGNFSVKDTDGNPGISLVKGVNIWLGGLDPGGNLKLAAGSNESDKSNFQPGLLNPETQEHINFNKIWKVKAEEIEEHRADYWDDFQINNPIAAIYAWPGRNNPFFEDYNNFELPPDRDLAPFWDENGDGIYSPDSGDYPIYRKTACPRPYYGDEMFWFAFHDLKPRLQKNGFPLYMQCFAHLFTYDCLPEELISNTIFMKLTLENLAFESIDSLFIGFNNEIQIGCSEDDYTGTIPEIETVFGYNSDLVDESCISEQGLGTSPPIFSFTLNVAPSNRLGVRQSLTKSISYFEQSDDRPIATLAPQMPYEYFNYLNGTWRDGLPLTFGNDGYQDGPTTHFIFPGDPADNEAWSEGTANQIPGKRNILASTGDTRIDQGEQKDMIVSFSATPGLYNKNTVYIQPMIQSIDALDLFFDHCFTSPPIPFSNYCNRVTSTEELNQANQILLSPNPASTELYIEFKETTPDRFQIINLIGELFYTQKQPHRSEHLIVNQWPSGVYILQAMHKEKLVLTKFVIVH